MVEPTATLLGARQRIEVPEIGAPFERTARTAISLCRDWLLITQAAWLSVPTKAIGNAVAIIRGVIMYFAATAQTPTL